MAQNVYSLNVVGYVNVLLNPSTNQFTLLANQLDFDGTGTNNTVLGIFGGTGTGSTNVPLGTKVYRYNKATGTYNTATLFNSGSWSTTAANPGLSPGEGVWVQLPTGATAPAVNLTLVGNVMQGTTVKPLSTVSGFEILSIVPPLSTNISGIGFVPSQTDKVYLYNSTSGTYSTRTRFATTWGGGEPTPSVAQAFWLQTTNVNGSWTQSFTVQ